MTFIIVDRPSDSPFVETIWHAQSERAGSFISLAAAYWEMVVTRYRGKLIFTVRGPATKAIPLQYQWVGAEWLGIRFKLGTFMPHLPLRHLADRRDANLPEANSASFWLHGAAWEYPTFDNADTFVGRLIHDGLIARDPVVGGVLCGHPHVLSPRAIQHHFLQSTGITYKAIQQMERATRARALLEQGASISDTVFQTGYFDQSHLTNSLKRFLGQTPAQIAHEAASAEVAVFSKTIP